MEETVRSNQNRIVRITCILYFIAVSILFVMGAFAQVPYHNQSVVRVSPTPVPNVYANSAIDISAGGTIVMLWDGPIADDADGGIYARVYDQGNLGLGILSAVYSGRINPSIAGVQGNPDVAVMPDVNTYAAVWESEQGGRSTIEMKYEPIGAGGTPSGNFGLDETLMGDNTNPAIAVNTAGLAIVVWQNLQSGNIYGRLAQLGSGRLGNHFQINSGAGTMQNPAVAMDADGNFMVVWEGPDAGGHTDIYTRRFNSDGSPVGVDLAIGANNNFAESNPDITMTHEATASRKFVITFQRNYGEEDAYVYAMRGSGTVDFGNPAYVHQNGVANYQHSASVDMDVQGNYTIAWVKGNGNGSSIVTRSFDANGNGEHGDFEVDASVLYKILSTDVAVSPAHFNVQVPLWGSENSSQDAVQTMARKINLQYAPTQISLSSASLDEGNAPNTYIGTFDVTDINSGDSHSLDLVAGSGDTDNASFYIGGANNDELYTSISFDYAVKSTYTLRVNASDGQSPGYSKSFIIQVNETNNNNVPSDITLSPNSILENNAIDEVVGSLSSEDDDIGDVHTYTLVAGLGGADNARFTIADNTLKANGVFDYETRSSYNVRIQTNDGNGGLFSKAFTVNILDQNENVAPTSTTLTGNSLAENNNIDDQVGTFSTSDPNPGDTHTYSLVAGSGDSGNGNFEIVDNVLHAKTVFDYEAQTSYAIRVQTDDDHGGIIYSVFVISITDVVDNQAPTGISQTSQRITENNNIGAVIAELSTVDPNAGDTHTYNLVAGIGDQDNGSFTISGNQLLADEEFDYETKSSYSLRVETTDNDGASFSRYLNIYIDDEFEQGPESVIELSNNSVDENRPSDTFIGNLSLTNLVGPSFQVNYSLVDGTGDTDNALFTAASAEIRSASTFNFEEKNSYSIRVQAEDQGQLTQQVFNISINDATDVSTDLTLSTNLIDEGNSIGDVIGEFTTTDEDAGDSFTYTLANGYGDNASFSISGDQLLAGEVYAVAAKSSYDIRVVSTSSLEGIITRDFTVNITSNDMTLTTTSSPENAFSFFTDAEVAGDPTGFFWDYSLVAGIGDTDNAHFEHNSNNRFTKKASTAFDYETKSSYSIRIRATDNDINTVEKAFVITITDVNDRPSSFTLSNSGIDENSPIGTLVGTYTVIDQDEGDTHTFSFTDNGHDDYFSLVDNQLFTAEIFDFETDFNPKNLITIATDQDGGTRQMATPITIHNVDEPISDITLSANDIDELNDIGDVIGTLDHDDPDDTYTFSLLTGDSDFSINGSNQLTADVIFDEAVQSAYTIKVRATNDNTGVTLDKNLVIAINSTNSSPNDVFCNPSNTYENNEIGQVVGTLIANDFDDATHFFSFVAGTADNDYFSIDGDQLHLNRVADFEDDNSYTIRIRATDPHGDDYTGYVTISVVNENEAPENFRLTSYDFDENNAEGFTLATMQADDPEGNNMKFALVEGEGADDNALFTTTGSSLRVLAAQDFETKNSFTIRASVDDYNANHIVEKVFTLTLNDEPETPTAISIDVNIIQENNEIGDVVGLLFAEDEDFDESHTFTFTSANTDFTLEDNQLKAARVFDYENEEEYSVGIRVTDKDGLFANRSVVVHISNEAEMINPSGFTLSGNTRSENIPANSVIGTFATDEGYDGIFYTYSMVDGIGSEDNENFVLTGATGSSLFPAMEYDYEEQSLHSIRVRSTSTTGGIVEKVFTVEIQDWVDAPTDIYLSEQNIVEGNQYNDVIGLLDTEDSDQGQTYTYTFDSNPGNAFKIVGNELQANKIFDFGGQTSYAITIKVQDSGNQVFYKDFTITVREDLTNKAPTAILLSVNSINENNAINAIIGTLSSTDEDEDDTHTYTLVGNPDNKFNINNDELRASVAFDYEEEDGYTVRIQTNDGNGGIFEDDFSISIVDVVENSAPTDITLNATSITENNEVSDVIGLFETEDVDAGDSHEYTFVSNPDNAFSIDDDQLKANVQFDFDTQDSYAIRVRTDDGNGGLLEKDFEITIIAENDVAPPQIVNFTPEDNATGVALDADLVITFNEPIFARDGFVYVRKSPASTVVFGGVVNGTTDIYTIEGNTMTLHLSESNQALKYDTDYHVLLYNGSLEDASGNVFNDGFTTEPGDNERWNFTTVNPAPTAMALTESSISENAASDAVIGQLSNTDANPEDTYTYVLLDDAEGKFTLDDDILMANAVFDFETEETYSITVRVTDSGNGTFDEDFDISVMDINEVPTLVTINNLSMLENNDVGAVVGTLSTTDPDDGDTHTYSLVGGLVDHAFFDIDGDDLIATASLDYETQTTYTVRVQSLDAGGLSAAQEFTVALTNIAEDDTAPTVVSVSPISGSDDLYFDDDLTITFSEPIQASEDMTGYVRVRQVGTNSGLSGRPGFMPDQVTIDGNQLVVHLEHSNNSSGVRGGYDYYVVVENNVVRDAAGNYYDDAATTNIDTWYTFSTVKKPQVLTVVPIGAKSVTALDFDIEAMVDTELSLDYDIEGPATLDGHTVSLTGETGQVTITVSQAGNEYFALAEQVVTFSVVDRLPQTISFLAIADKTFGDSFFTVSVSSNSGLAVSLSHTGPIVLDGKKVTIIGAGTATITASQAGNDTYAPSEDETITFEIAKATQTINLDPIDDKFTTDDSFIAGASVDSGLPLTFEVEGPATVDGATITLTGDEGEVTVVAHQAGNENYLSATANTTFAVTAPVVATVGAAAVKIECYPNPATDWLTVSGLTANDQASFEIMDFNGKLIQQAKLKYNEPIAIHYLQSGLYMVRVNNGKTTTTTRVLIQ